jgi:SOS-response transcriptional repressor LexA
MENLQAKLLEIRHKLGINQKGLAQKLGVSAPYLNEIITGKKSGKRKIIEFAERLGVSVEYLTGDQFFIPLVAEVTASEPFACNEDNCLEFINLSSLPGITRELARKCYALRVQGDSMFPFQKNGDLLIVEKESCSKIKHGDKVVLHHNSSAFIRHVEIAGETLILRPLNLGLTSQMEEMASLENFEKIVYTISS